MSVHPRIHHHLEGLHERGFQLKLSDEQLSFVPPLYGPLWHDRSKIGQVKEYRIPLLLLNVAKVGLGLYIDINDWRRDYRKTSLRALEYMAAYAGVHFPLTDARLVGKGKKQVEFQLNNEVGLTDVITQEAPEGLLEPINRLLQGQDSAFRWVMLGDFSTSRSGVCSYLCADRASPRPQRVPLDPSPRMPPRRAKRCARAGLQVLEARAMDQPDELARKGSARSQALP